EAAVKPAGPTEDENEEHFRRAAKGEHVERDELRRDREECSGDPGIDRRNRVDRDDAGMGGNADRAGAEAVLLQRSERLAEGRGRQPAGEEEKEERYRQAE